MISSKVHIIRWRSLSQIANGRFQHSGHDPRRFVICMHVFRFNPSNFNHMFFSNITCRFSDAMNFMASIESNFAMASSGVVSKALTSFYARIPTSSSCTNALVHQVLCFESLRPMTIIDLSTFSASTGPEKSVLHVSLACCSNHLPLLPKVAGFPFPCSTLSLTHALIAWWPWQIGIWVHTNHFLFHLASWFSTGKWLLGTFWRVKFHLLSEESTFWGGAISVDSILFLVCVSRPGVPLRGCSLDTFYAFVFTFHEARDKHVVLLSHRSLPPQPQCSNPCALFTMTT